MGLHTAEPYLHEAGYVGMGVHRAARICAAAHGGEILVSNATAGIVEDEELPELELRDLGEFELKDMTAPQRLFEVVAEGVPHLEAPPRARGAGEGDSPYGRTGTLLATDVVGWRAIMRELGDDGAAVVAASYHDLLRDVAREHAGRLVEAAGDHGICVFGGASDAVAAAARVRAAFRDRARGAGVRPVIRSALHTGRLVAEGHGGIALVHCLELCASAEPGQVLLSHATRTLLEGKILDGLELRDLGERRLRGFDTPTRVFELVG